MKIAAIAYFLVGVCLALVLVIGKRRKITDSTASIADPTMFWLYILLWPVVFVVMWLRSDSNNKNES
jgi:hypothetical protein